jgi:hypothetical protein
MHGLVQYGVLDHGAIGPGRDESAGNYQWVQPRSNILIQPHVPRLKQGVFQSCELPVSSCSQRFRLQNFGTYTLIIILWLNLLSKSSNYTQKVRNPSNPIQRFLFNSSSKPAKSRSCFSNPNCTSRPKFRNVIPTEVEISSFPRVLPPQPFELEPSSRILTALSLSTKGNFSVVPEEIFYSPPATSTCPWILGYSRACEMIQARSLKRYQLSPLSDVPRWLTSDEKSRSAHSCFYYGQAWLAYWTECNKLGYRNGFDS